MDDERIELDPKVIAYRVASNSSRIRELEAWRREVDGAIGNARAEIKALRTELVETRTEMGDLGTAVKGLQRTILGFAFTIAGSAVVALITVLAATGRI